MAKPKIKWVEYSSWAEDREGIAFDYQMEAKVTKGSPGSMIDPPEPDDVDITSILVQSMAVCDARPWTELTADQFVELFGEEELDEAIEELNMKAYERRDADGLDDEY